MNESGATSKGKAPLDKEFLRVQMRGTLAALSAPERKSESEALVQRFFERSEWACSKRLAAFYPRKDEPDIRPVFERAWSTGRLLALPSFDTESGRYRMRQIVGMTDLVVGSFGILEPNNRCLEVSIQSLDLALVPGVCFSTDGGRVGRGRGFYDRLLVGFRGVACGVVFDGQILAETPLEAHDIRMDLILTSKRHWSVEGDKNNAR
jgi:5-formyltetrahydrofolate cyclo-ligase